MYMSEYFLWYTGLLLSFSTIPFVLHFRDPVSSGFLLLASFLQFAGLVKKSFLLITRRKIRSYFAFPGPFSVFYGLCCLALGCRHIFFEQDVLSYTKFCIILTIIGLFYFGFYLILKDLEKFPMFTIVYDVTIGFLFGIPVSVFWWMFLKETAFFAVSYIWWLLFWGSLFGFILLLKDSSRKVKRDGHLFHIYKMFLFPVYYVKQDAVSFFYKFYSGNGHCSTNWDTDLSCAEKSKFIAKELLYLKKEMAGMPKNRLYVTETHDLIIRHIHNICFQIPDPLAAPKVGLSFDELYRRNWEQTKNCKKCKNHPGGNDCPFSPRKRPTYIVIFKN